MASAGDGLVAVGANVIILPSSYYDGDVEWKAWTWVYNSGLPFGDWNTENPNYNMIVGVPEPDAEGLEWFEPGFDMGPKEFDYNTDILDEDDNPTPIVWEEHSAPFSADATYHGRPSYQWTTGSIIADIYMRRYFKLDPSQRLTGPVYLACTHDDSPCEYYINGELVYSTEDGWEDHGRFILLDDEQKELIKLDGEENVIAVHVHQNWGGALADVGLYTKIEGGLDMGYTTPWEGKVLFNNFGGYNWDGQSPSNNPRHPWSALYEAQEGDVYTFTIAGSSDEPYQEILQFKSPIRIEEGHNYSFKARLKADKPITAGIVQLGDNDSEDIELAYEDFVIEAPEEGAEEDYEGTLIDLDFWAEEEVSNFMFLFDFGGGEDSTAVAISEISLRDITEGDNEEDAVELWVGTHYFNYINMTKKSYIVWDPDLNEGEGGYREATEDELDIAEIEQVEDNAPEITGRVETLAWTMADFDDSMWDDQMMPVGNEGYMDEVQSIWPGGDNTNYWIRRNFELDEIEQLSYDLNVCHDDVYETYVNGHLMQKNVGWTNGKNPVQVHIPAKYLNVGKNVIATYIQQNWGGKFYDCGINVEEVNYDACAQLLKDAIAYAETDTLLTNKMREDVQALIAQAKQYLNNPENDAAELKNYAKEFKAAVNVIFAYSSDVKTLRDTYEICRKMEDKGYWGTALEDAVTALSICATSDELRPYLTNLRDARKATVMERHEEKYVGAVPQAVSMEMLGQAEYMEYDEEEDDDILRINPTYYIYNVGAKLFLGAGEAWGTHLALEYISNPMMIIQAAESFVDEETGETVFDTEQPIEGAYYIESFRPNGNIGSMDFLNWNGFIDCPLNNQGRWEIIPVEGKENVFHIAQYGQAFATDTTYTDEGEMVVTGGGKKLLGLRSGDNQYAPSYYIVDTDMRTPELETNQWMFITREELLGLIATASETNPVDLSFLIENPGYDQRLSIDSWIFDNVGGNVSVFGRNGDNPNFVFEAYNAEEFEMYQNLKPRERAAALPAGTYKLCVQGYYRDGNESSHVDKVLSGAPIAQRALFFAGPKVDTESGFYDISACESMPLMPITIDANKYPGIGYSQGGLRMPGTYSGQPLSACAQAAVEYFPSGLYQNEMVFTITEEDAGKLSIGIMKPMDEAVYDGYGDWCVMDNWRIKYYGTDVVDPDAIKDITTDEIDNNTNKDAKGIYNMLGQKLSKLQKGVNIINGKKVAVK